MREGGKPSLKATPHFDCTKVSRLRGNDTIYSQFDTILQHQFCMNIRGDTSERSDAVL